MNKIVMFKKFTEEGIDGTNNVVIIDSSKTLEEFHASFETSLKTYVNKIIELNKPMNVALKDVTPEDMNGLTYNDNLERFNKLYEEVEKFKKENYIFEFENQYISLTDYFWNDEHYYEYEILYLNDWLESKVKELSVKPKYLY